MALQATKSDEDMCGAAPDPRTPRVGLSSSRRGSRSPRGGPTHVQTERFAPALFPDGALCLHSRQKIQAG